MIDLSPGSIRIGLVMILGTVWFWLIIDTIMNSNKEDSE
tara:strand:- start:358 stop:474 length:117 start_codon:yes stop_codon:yes gene_type:complete